MSGLAAEAQLEDPAGRRQEIALRVLRIDAGLDRRPATDDLLLPQRQGLAGGDAELPFDQIETGHGFGHRMFDLKPGVHLEEVVGVGTEAARGVGDELHRARALIADRQSRIGRSLRHGGARLLRKPGRRTLLDHLLVAALQRAVALEEVDAASMAVGEHLHLDVAGRGDVFLDQHPPVAEGALRLAAGAFERRLEFDMRVDPAHAASAPARDRLDQDRVADLVGLLAQELRVLVVAVVARDDGNAGLLHQRLGRILQPHRAHRLRRRTDEHDARPRAGFREIGVLRQEPIARMQALGADPLRQARRSPGRRDSRLSPRRSRGLRRRGA